VKILESNYKPNAYNQKEDENTLTLQSTIKKNRLYDKSIELDDIGEIRHSLVTRNNQDSLMLET